MKYYVFTKGRRITCLFGKEFCTDHLKTGWHLQGRMTPQESKVFSKGYLAAVKMMEKRDEQRKTKT